MNDFRHLLDSDQGNSVVEYGLVLALLSALLIATFTDLRQSFLAVFLRVIDCLNNATGGLSC